MKQLIMAALLLTLFSCMNKKSTKDSEKKEIIGSTIENINNSPHSVIRFQN